MKARSSKSLSGEYAKLSRQLNNGKPHPTTEPTALSLKDIKLWPGVFQHRSIGSNASRAHVAALAVSIRRGRGKPLHPMTVWWDGKKWACIDGHHRHEAYKEVGVDGPKTVPVNVFVGSLDQAMAEAAGGNTRDKLSMTSKEKSNAAWRLVAMTRLPKPATAAMAGVSEATVATMRKVRIQLVAREGVEEGREGFVSGPDFRDLTWAEAKRVADQRDPKDFDRDAANEKKAQEWAMLLHKTFGKEGGKYPEILARALDIYDTRLLDAITAWNAVPEDDASDVGEP